MENRRLVLTHTHTLQQLSASRHIDVAKAKGGLWDWERGRVPLVEKNFLMSGFRGQERADWVETT